MTCKHSIITITRDGDEFDCGLNLSIICEKCPFGPFPYDSLVVWIENGDVDYVDHTGDWLVDGELDDILSVFSEDVLPILEMDEDVNEIIQESKEGKVTAIVIMVNVSTFYSKAGWHRWPDWHFAPSEREIEYDDLIINVYQ